MGLLSGVNGFSLLGSNEFLFNKASIFSCYVVMKFPHGVVLFKYPIFLRTNIPTNTLMIN